MKILHIASFSGNIGDNASHIGLNQILAALKLHPPNERLEIRQFYKSYNGPEKKNFDRDFISYLNSFELCIIGGGGFLDYWVPNSETGTTLDISPSLIKEIKTKVLITSVGCMPHKSVPEGNIEKFKDFLDSCFENDNVRIALRNDGSVDTIRKNIGEKYLQRLPEILDNGFFFNRVKPADFPIPKEYVAINITDDQLKMNSDFRNEIDEEAYYGELRRTIVGIVEELGMNVLFIPHIYSDLRAITKIQSLLPDRLMRNNVFVAPCVQGDAGAKYIYSLYMQSSVILASRLHANICNLGMAKPVIGLAALDRVRYLYEYLGIPEYAHDISKSFSKVLIDDIANMRANSSIVTNQVNDVCTNQRAQSLLTYKNILQHFGYA